MTKVIVLLIIISTITITSLSSQPSANSIKRVLAEINELRSQGCICGSKRMAPAKPLQWDEALYKVSNKYARYMSRNSHFDHVSKEGEDL